MVLEFIEGILGVRPVTIELGQTHYRVVGVGDQHGVFVTGDAPAGAPIRFHERHLLAIIVLAGQEHFAFECAAQTTAACHASL
ncbi:MAG: hypothetical protein U1F55_12010 [Chitinivorax sp.]